MPHKIKIQSGPSAKPNPMRCRVGEDRKVKWSSSEYEDWRVVFGPQAPVHPKVAWPGGNHPDGGPSDTLTLTVNRPEDFRHVKYVVVASNANGLSHEDPELIVDDG